MPLPSIGSGRLSKGINTKQSGYIPGRLSFILYRSNPAFKKKELVTRKPQQQSFIILTPESQLAVVHPGIRYT